MLAIDHTLGLLYKIALWKIINELNRATLTLVKYNENSSCFCLHCSPVVAILISAYLFVTRVEILRKCQDYYMCIGHHYKKIKIVLWEFGTHVMASKQAVSSPGLVVEISLYLKRNRPISVRINIFYARFSNYKHNPHSACNIQDLW